MSSAPSTATSRIMVAGLPPYASSDRLRDMFGAVGEITDAKVMRTSSGKSRKFGFVGFKSAAEAKAAVKRFNKAYMDTAKIKVCVAKPAGSKALPRAWSKYSRGSSKHRDAHPEQYLAEGGEEEEAEDGGAGGARGTKRKGAVEVMSDQKRKKLADFFEVMRGRDKSRVWENDAVGASASSVQGTATAAASSSAGAAAAAAPVAPQGASDLSYLRSKVVLKTDDTEGSASAAAGSLAAAAAPAVAERLESGRLFVRNLAFTCTEADLDQCFRKFGALSEVRIPVDKSRRPKGFA